MVAWTDWEGIRINRIRMLISHQNSPIKCPFKDKFFTMKPGVHSPFVTASRLSQVYHLSPIVLYLDYLTSPLGSWSRAIASHCPNITKCGWKTEVQQVGTALPRLWILKKLMYKWKKIPSSALVPRLGLQPLSTPFQ